MNRRTFIGAGAALLAAVGAAAWAWFARRSPPPVSESEHRPSSAAPRARFPARYTLVLSAMCDRLLPAEGERPGALALGAWTFIERELGRPDMQAAYRLLMRGAVQLDRVARAQTGTGFVESPPEARDAVIQAMQQGEGAAARFEPARFVETMIGLTLEGALSDPAHGGNLEERGWTWLGYAMHPPRPACH